jgi:hypothetical protein
MTTSRRQYDINHTLLVLPQDVVFYLQPLTFPSIPSNKLSKYWYCNMSFLSPSSTFIRLTNRAGVTSQLPRLCPFSSAIRYSTPESSQGYGDGKGDPKGEMPQEQGSSSDAHHNSEHPGPAPPSKGQGTGGATKAGSGAKDPSEASASSGGSRSKQAKETGSSHTGGDVGGSGGESTSPQGGAKPKISDMKIPNERDAEKQAEVEQHNKEFEQRYDRAPKAQDDKVDKKFWSGESPKSS